MPGQSLTGSPFARSTLASPSDVSIRRHETWSALGTCHNKPIARIIGIPDHAEPGLRALIAGGAVAWGGGKPRYELPEAMAGLGPSGSQMVLEDSSRKMQALAVAATTIRLAAARTLQHSVGEEVQFACFDIRLGNAARLLGMSGPT